MSNQPVQPYLGLLHAYRGAPCPYCKQPMLAAEGRRPTRDHVYPRALGGRLTLENRLIVCAPCNHEKADMTLVQFAEHLTRKRDRRAAIVLAIITLKRYQDVQVLPEPVYGPPSVKGVPLEYEDTKAQAAFEAVYRKRAHLLRQPAYKAHKGSFAAMMDSGQAPLPRGATLPSDDQPAPTFVHSANKPARRMTALETAQWLRECAAKSGRAWPLA